MKLRYFILMVPLIVIGVVVAPQWSQWRTGRPAAFPIALAPMEPHVVQPDRIWIDTDAACGAMGRIDPDDCFAIAWLVAQGGDISGVSTSFGNAPGHVVADRLAALFAQLDRDGLSPPPMFVGYGAPATDGMPPPPGIAALQSSLEERPLTILALGPLTNVAAALNNRPDLQRNVTRIVSVMGHQPGHLFHPTEGNGRGALFGHGPIFRDLNVSVDPEATRRILEMSLPMTLVPYDAARSVLIDRADLDALVRQGPWGEWLVQSSQDWLDFWNDVVGLSGFYPFDWVAAAYLVEPGLFACALVTARMTRQWVFWLLPRDSLVVEPGHPENPSHTRVLYCPEASPDLHDVLTSH